MDILPEQLQYIILVLNFFVTLILFGYSFYLYKIERNLRKKFHSVNTKAAKIIEDANNKAIHILNHSKYVSDTMKEHAEHSFEHVLNDLKSENEKFYKQLEHTYLDRSEEFIQKIEKANEEDINKFEKNISDETNKSKELVGKEIEDDYQAARKDLEGFKEAKKAEIAATLKSKLASATATVMPSYLKIEDQEKFAKEVIEKAAAEGFLN